MKKLVTLLVMLFIVGPNVALSSPYSVSDKTIFWTTADLVSGEWGMPDLWNTEGCSSRNATLIMKGTRGGLFNLYPTFTNYSVSYGDSGCDGHSYYGGLDKHEWIKMTRLGTLVPCSHSLCKSSGVLKYVHNVDNRRIGAVALFHGEYKDYLAVRRYHNCESYSCRRKFNNTASFGYVVELDGRADSVREALDMLGAVEQEEEVLDW